MDSRLDKIEEKLDRVLDALTQSNLKAENRITKLETHQKGFIAIFSTILTAIGAAVTKLFLHEV